MVREIGDTKYNNTVKIGKFVKHILQRIHCIIIHCIGYPVNTVINNLNLKRLVTIGGHCRSL